MPKNEESVAILKDTKGRKVALKGVQVRARLHGLMAEVEVEQSYTNPQKTNIEAVYTFPLPIGAVLLGLDVEIAGKKLSGSVVERKQAERDYEDAVTDGDSAVMLQEAGPGLYTASIGNLLAGESAVIRYRYGLMLSWQGPQLRFLLPTTIAPRYGDAIAAGLQPHQIPESALDVEYPLDLAVSIEGDLASASIASPSHLISVGRSDNGIVVRISGKAVLDRDFVLTLESESAQSACVQTKDGEGQVAVASLRIPPVPASEDKALSLKVVIDCSGSMEGISISQARKAALEILNLLRPQDSFNVTLFGSEHEHIFRTMVPATAKYITEAWNRLENLNADMGGTEMEKALYSAFSLSRSDEDTTLLLITDGEIHEQEKLIKRAEKSGHRIFTVGVGTAVADNFLQKLARKTGGACELVAPQEGMAERVVSQFHRMRQPKLDKLSIEWPVHPDWTTPLPEAVFAGDTVHAFAGFRSLVTGSVILKVQGSSDVSATIASANEVEIPRIAASIRMTSASAEEGLRLALGYQLLSRWTNFLVIAERSDKAEDLPELHQVPQMLAAGWGGTGSLPAVFSSGSGARNSSVLFSRRAAGADRYDIPAFLRKSADDGVSPTISAYLCVAEADEIYEPGTPAKFIAAMEASLVKILRQPSLPKSLDALERWGLDKDVLRNLNELVSQGQDEAKVIVAFIYALSESSVGGVFGRSFKRAVLKAWKQMIPGHDIDRLMRESLMTITSNAWNWTPQVLVLEELITA